MAEDKMELYNQLCTPPNDALKTIDFGALKGKSDINPQWRYEALTNALGPCGVGWKFEIADSKTVAMNSGETMLYVLVNLYWMNKDTGEWSAPIPGWGGDYIIKRNKNGLVGNDEAFKMATTDALGTAAKMIGVAADVYRGLVANGASDSKYARRDYAAQNAQNGAGRAQNGNANTSTTNPLKEATRELNEKIKSLNLPSEKVKELCQKHYGTTNFRELKVGQVKNFTYHLEEWAKAS